MRTPRFGEPTRVAFVGAEAVCGHHVPWAPAGGLLPRFFEFRAAGGDDPEQLAQALRAWAPHVVVVLCPGDLAASALAGVPAVTLGWGAGEGFDRVVAPGGWRRLPLPVDDRVYAEVPARAASARPLLVGASTEHREKFLVLPKHEYDLLHYAHGLHGERLRDVLARTDVAVHLHPTDQPGFSDFALVHLAAGHLLLSEPLVPSFGLEPGIDFVEFRRTDELQTLLFQLHRRPDAYDRVRLRGREKAEEHRAGRVWPRLVADLLEDVRVFGRAA